MRQRGPHPLRVLLVLVTSLMLVVITMGGAARQANAAPPALIVGILHIGSVTDGGYNQAHAEGIRYMQKMLPGVEVIEVENVPESADAERVMETMIQRGAKLIIAASFGYLDPALNVAKRHPDVQFEHPSGHKLAPTQGADVIAMIVDSPITVVQVAERRGAYSVGYHYVGVQKFAPKGWISGLAFNWGPLYVRFARAVMDGTWRSEAIYGNVASDYLVI